MVFKSPSRANLELSKIPDSIPLADFLLDERWGRQPIAHSRNPFVCGLTGETYSVDTLKQRVDYLARGLDEVIDWGSGSTNETDSWKRVACIFSYNSLDTLIVSWSIQRLNGISSPINADFSTSEVSQQLTDSKASVLFTCRALLATAEAAAAKAGIPKHRIFVINLPDDTPHLHGSQSAQTIQNLIERGRRLPELPKLKWANGQGARQVAFLCYSSGTSGLPKGVMISHHNVIANVLQITMNEASMRMQNGATGIGIPSTETSLCALPVSHIYGLVYISCLSVFRGDQVVILPRYEFETALACVVRHKINTLFLVPPIIVQIVKNNTTCQKYDLSSVRSIITGAAPLGAETATEIGRLYPHWLIRQGYGLTETATVASSSMPGDIVHGSSGMLIPGFKARIVAADGREVLEHETEGELLLRSPSVVLGYSNNAAANKEAFTNDGWLKTGDVAMFRVSPAGNEHLWILDRAKDLIKVKGHQVAPAELEAHILTHPNVVDCAVIPVPDERAGEVPKAFVQANTPTPGTDLARAITLHVQNHKAKFKWLAGGVEFVDIIPKSPTGKILRRVLRDQELKRTGSRVAKL